MVKEKVKCKNCKYYCFYGCSYEEINKYNNQTSFTGHIEMNKEGDCEYYKKDRWFGIKLI
jgi:hypothetical protein